MQTINEVLTKSRDLERETLAVLDNERQREDLMALYNDIRTQIKTNSPDMENIIYEYADLLQDEIMMYCPYRAYEAGAILGASVKPNDDNQDCSFKQFIRRIELDPENKKTHSKVQNQYNIVHSLLGDTSDLINDFTDLYRRCHGIIPNNIKVFFDMGYAVTCSNG